MVLLELRSVLLVFVVSGVRPANIGRFWHITDHHWDTYYSQHGQDPMEICPSSYGRPISNAGPLGDYKCDSPWRLIQSSIDAMKRLHPDPDFILWTGDDPFHTSQQDKYLSKDKVLQIILNISMTIREAFPATPIFPALGNHDYHPKSQIPPGGSEILTAIAKMWQPWLSVGAYSTFKEEGYYVDSLPGSKNHIIMILNSNFWYNSNKAVNGSGDPGQEFLWMEQTLHDAAAKSQKVYIAGHVPPGYFEFVSNYHKRWFYDYYNERFVQIIRNNKDVIAGMFFGHHHSDAFRIIKDANGNIIQSILLAPGVTPWATTLGGVVNGSNNPGIRLVEYDKDTMNLMDFTQFYIDLSTANNQNKVDPSELWKEEYRATTKYGIADITTSSLGPLATAMREGCERNDSDCPNTFVEYYKMNSVSYDKGECNETCQKFQLCAVTEVESAGYESCMTNWGNHGTRVQPSIWCMLLTSLASWLKHWGLNLSSSRCTT